MEVICNWRKEESKVLEYFIVDLKTNEITYSDEARNMLGFEEYCNRSFDYFLTRLHPNYIGLVHRVSRLAVKKRSNFRLKFKLSFGSKKNILAYCKIAYDSFRQPKEIIWSIIALNSNNFFDKIQPKDLHELLCWRKK